MHKPERFIYRYKYTMIPRLNHVLELESKFFALNRQATKDEKQTFCIELKYAYESSWKTMRDFLQAHGKYIFLPRKIFIEMSKYINTEPWILFLDNLNIFFSNRNNEKIIDEMISNYYAIYEQMFDDFLHFITNQEDICTVNNAPNYHFVHKNHSVLDTYTFVLLVQLFLSYPNIKSVYLFGSRATDRFRESSDIDLIMSGKYNTQEFKKIKTEIDNLNIPYMVDLHDINDENEYCGNKFIAESLKYSIPFYDRKDFYMD